MKNYTKPIAIVVTQWMRQIRLQFQEKIGVICYKKIPYLWSKKTGG